MCPPGEVETAAAVVGAVVNLFGGGDGGDLSAAGFNYAIQDVEKNLYNVYGALQKQINDSLWQHVGIETDIQNNILNRIALAEFNLSTQADRNLQAVLSRIVGVTSSGSAVDILTATAAKAALDTLERNISGTLRSVVGDAASTILRVLGGHGDLLSGIDIKLDSVIRGQGSIIDTLGELLKREVSTVVNNTVHLGGDVFDVILGRVQGVLADQNVAFGKTVDVFDRIINDGIGRQMADTNAIGVLNLDAQDRQAGYLDKIAAANDRIAANIEAGRTPLGYEKTGASIWDWLSGIDGKSLDEMADDFYERLYGGTAHENVDDKCKLNFLGKPGERDWGTRLLQWITLGTGMMILPLKMANIRSDGLVKPFRACFPDQTLSPSDAIASFLRGNIQSDEMYQDIKQNGFTERDAKIMLTNATVPPAIGDLVSMWLRGLIKTPQLESALKVHGITADWWDAIEKAAYFIPPPSDLVQMAVKDVWDPQAVSSFRMADDFPQEFEKYAAMQGLSHEWALNYWMAHWRLPSETMGFDMYHRGIIDNAQLQLLMKALDIMPGWRDKLIQLSFDPLTRVDIRRMHKLGVLDNAQVRRAYQDIGYSPENADRLLQFTIELNKKDSILTTNVASDLHRSNILEFYKDGVIDKPQTEALLLQAGINVAAAALFIADVDYKKHRAANKMAADLVVARFDNHRYTFDEAVNAARGLDQSADETEQLLLKLELHDAKKHKTPPRADLDKMLAKGFITDAQYLQTMEQLGYSPQWATIYANMVKGGDNGTAAA